MQTPRTQQLKWNTQINATTARNRQAHTKASREQPQGTTSLSTSRHRLRVVRCSLTGATFSEAEIDDDDDDEDTDEEPPPE